MAEVDAKEIKAEEDESIKADSVEIKTEDVAVAEIPKSETDKQNSGIVKTEPVTKLESDIIRQIEYYFSDSNLPRDKFLTEQISKDEGWVPVTVLLTFKRLASLSPDPDFIVQAVLKSDEGLVEVSEDRLKFRRHPERPLSLHNEEYKKNVISRTAYAKGFPTTGIEMTDIIEFMSGFDKVSNIVMRKYHEKTTKTYHFKGSILVTFADKQHCAEFIKKEKIQYKDCDLIRKWQEDYLEEKKEERNAKCKRGGNKQKEDNGFALPKGTVLYVEGFGNDTTREDIKAAISEIGGDVAYVEFQKGDENGHIRLTEENSAKTIFEKMEDGKFKVKDKEITARLLDGEEETDFLQKVVQNMKLRRNIAGRGRRGGGRQQYGGFNRKRKASNDPGSEPAVKH